MSKNDGLRHSEYWQERAEEARARADEMSDEKARATMLNIAYLYDLMAERAAKNEATESQPRPRSS
jgi:pyruvate-formate lyase